MVYCRGCGKEIHETALTCPACGAQQLIKPVTTETSSRSTGKLIGWAIVWTVVFWFGSLIITGFLVGVFNPQNAQEAASKAGANLSGIFFILALIASILLTIWGKLPGTGKK